ncbi:MAG: SPASM domain-containing protein, partial [Phycisphaerales bacterium]
AFFKDLGLCHMQFIPCLEPDPRDQDIAAPFSVSPAEYGAFLCELFDCWIDDFQDGRPTTFIRWFDSVFGTYVDVPPPECTLMAECGHYVVIEHNGDVYSCDFYVEPAWRLGNVLADNLVDLLNSPRQEQFGRRKAELADNCQTCRWLTHCRGGCPKERFGAVAAAQPSYFCEAYQTFFRHADDRLRGLADDWRQAQRTSAELCRHASRVLDAGVRPGRNDPCPCGSGRKYKRCCGASAHVTDAG